MASLARSLLALAVLALVHAAYAQGPNRKCDPQPIPPHRIRSSCRTVLFGRKADDPRFRYYLDPIKITDANSVVKINDPNYDPRHHIGTVLIGEEITVCNRNGNFAPEMSLEWTNSPNKFDFVQVTLGFCVPPPILMEMYVTRYVEVPGPHHNIKSDDITKHHME